MLTRPSHPDAEASLGGDLVSPSRKRAAVAELQSKFGVSERRACKMVDQPRSSQRFEAKPRTDEAPLVKRMLQLARARLRHGYRRIGWLLREEGWRATRPRPDSPPCVRLRPRPRPQLQPHTLVPLVTPVPKPSYRLVHEIQPGQMLRVLPSGDCQRRGESDRRPVRGPQAEFVGTARGDCQAGCRRHAVLAGL